MSHGIKFNLMLLGQDALFRAEPLSLGNLTAVYLTEPKEKPRRVVSVPRTVTGSSLVLLLNCVKVWRRSSRLVPGGKILCHIGKMMCGFPSY